MTEDNFKHLDSKLNTIIEKIDELPTRKSQSQAKHEILKAIRGEDEQTESMNGPTNPIRREQVETVKLVLEDAIRKGIAMTLSEACQEAWEDLTGGYPSPKALYNYCHEHALLFPVAL